MSAVSDPPADLGSREGTEGSDEIEMLRSMLDGAHEAFIAIDAEGIVMEFNREAERTFGFARVEAVGRELAGLIIPDRYRAAHRSALRRRDVAGERRLVGRRLELTAVHREGHEFPVELTISEARTDRQGAGRLSYHAFVHDISERLLSARVLVAMQSVTHAMARAESPERAMASLLEKLGQSMDWKAGSYWRLAHDGALELMASWTAPEIRATEFETLGANLRLVQTDSLPGRALANGSAVWVEDFTAETSFPRARAALTAGLHTAISVPVTRKAEIVGVIEFFAAELRVRDRSISDALSTVGAQIGEMLGVLEERQALMTSLARLALTDEVTGLPNRRAWEDGLRRELARAARDGHQVCVAVVDLDEFKRYNDAHGHLAGDQLLAEAARAWQGQLRASDLLARYGGEEFTAVIPTWPLEIAVAVVERLRRATPEGVTASAGVACWDRTESASQLFGRADAALYEAKQQGRNRTVAAPDPADPATPSVPAA